MKASLTATFTQKSQTFTVPEGFDPVLTFSMTGGGGGGGAGSYSVSAYTDEEGNTYTVVTDGGVGGTGGTGGSGSGTVPVKAGDVVVVLVGSGGTAANGDSEGGRGGFGAVEVPGGYYFCGANGGGGNSNWGGGGGGGASALLINGVLKVVVGGGGGGGGGGTSNGGNAHGPADVAARQSQVGQVTSDGGYGGGAGGGGGGGFAGGDGGAYGDGGGGGGAAGSNYAADDVKVISSGYSGGAGGGAGHAGADGVIVVSLNSSAMGYVRNGGVWKMIKSGYYKYKNAWKQIYDFQIKKDGVWTNAMLFDASKLALDFGGGTIRQDNAYCRGNGAYAHPRGGGGGGCCVVSTAFAETGMWKKRDRDRLIVWCERQLHGKSYGECFRRGYQVLGSKVIVPAIKRQDKRGELYRRYYQWAFTNGTELVQGKKSSWLALPNTVFWIAGFMIVGAVVSTEYATQCWKKLYE
jgi:hypothetical protein